MKHNAKILLLDIETAPILAWVWKIWDENIGVNQIKSDVHLLSFAAKWLDDPESKMIYADQRHAKNIEDDRLLLEKLWELLDEADIVIGHNSRQFDVKMINTRFIINGIKPPSSYKQIDTLEIAKHKFRFTSNKLENISKKVCKRYTKFEHRKFSGFELWKACLAGNKEAWKEMEKYNKIDVLTLEEVYKVFQPWDNTYNPDLYTDNNTMLCACGSTDFIKYGFRVSVGSKLQRYKCVDCGAERVGKENLFSKAKRASIKK